MADHRQQRQVVQARCFLSAWPEWRALRAETVCRLAAVKDLLCHWGAVEEIVTDKCDNGATFVAARDWLAERYSIRHIRISAYNSRANGIVEHQHRTIREECRTVRQTRTGATEPETTLVLLPKVHSSAPQGRHTFESSRVVEAGWLAGTLS